MIQSLQFDPVSADVIENPVGAEDGIEVVFVIFTVPEVFVQSVALTYITVQDDTAVAS